MGLVEAAAAVGLVATVAAAVDEAVEAAVEAVAVEAGPGLVVAVEAAAGLAP